jgi:hypothetical protein
MYKIWYKSKTVYYLKIHSLEQLLISYEFASIIFVLHYINLADIALLIQYST